MSFISFLESSADPAPEPKWRPWAVAKIIAVNQRRERAMGQRAIGNNFWHCVTNTIPRIYHNTSCTTTCIKGRDSQNGKIHNRHIKSFKHDLSNLLSVRLGIQRSFNQNLRTTTAPSLNGSYSVLGNDSSHLIRCSSVLEPSIIANHSTQ
jgi:hypothetical protein